MNVLRSTAALLCAASALFTLTAAPARASGPDAQAAKVLHASRIALGGAALDRVRVVELDANVKGAGLAGTGRQFVEIGGTRFSEFSSLPPVDTSDGFDGKDVWNGDGSGLIWNDGGDADRSQEISQAFISDYRLWTAGNGGASVRWGGEKKAGSARFDSLVVTAPGSLLPFELWFDRTSHLPVKLVQSLGPVVTTSTFSSYGTVDGVRFPRVVHTETSDGNSNDSTVTRAIANPPNGTAQLERPKSSVHDFTIAGGASQTTVPFELAENHVYLSLMLNGKGPYRFIYDTGGANVVDPAVAAEIGAAGHGSMQGGGVGAATESLSFAKVDTMQIGDATIKDQLFAVAPTRQGFGMSAGRPVDGLIGFEVLSRLVTTFDYSHNRIVLAMPGAPAPAGGTTIPFVLYGRQPQFACTIDKLPSECTLDTGARDSISLMRPFMAAHPEIVPAKLTAVGVSGFGFGGPAFGKLGRVSSIGIGPYAISNVVADFTTQERGAFAAPFVAANVGGNLLRRFDITLDYDKQTMTMIPNSDYSAPDVYERSGLFLLNRKGSYIVMDVRPGTPAAAAGIVKGDTIATVDGVPASSLTLQHVRETLANAPGTVVKLGIVSAADKSARTVALTLQDFV